MSIINAISKQIKDTLKEAKATIKGDMSAHDFIEHIVPPSYMEQYNSLKDMVKAMVDPASAIDEMVKPLYSATLGDREVVVAISCLYGKGVNHPMAGALSSPDGQGLILVNQAFLDAPRKTKAAIFAHELSHLQLGHTNLTVKRFLSNAKRNVFGRTDQAALQSEVEADGLAAKCGHGETLLNLLREMRDLRSSHGKESKEYETRIAELETYQAKNTPSCIHIPVSTIKDVIN